MENVLFFDLEVPVKPGAADSVRHINDIGGWYNGTHFHDSSVEKFEIFARGARFICGHNIVDFDLPILRENGVGEWFFEKPCMDTLYLSALLFPRNPYHKLVKDYKLVSLEASNPVSDSKLAMRLLGDCLREFHKLPDPLKQVYYSLLNDFPPFTGFFSFYKQKFLDPPFFKKVGRRRHIPRRRVLFLAVAIYVAF